MERINLLILNPSKEDRAEMIDMLSNIDYIVFSGEVASFESALEVLQQVYIDVILVDCMTDGDGYAVAEKIFAEYPNKALIIIERELKEETMYKALSAGAMDIIIRPFTAAKLINAIYRSYKLMKSKIMANKEETSAKIMKKGLGHVITVFSKKGGVGKTFIAVNLAIAIFKITKKKVVLVDLDLDSGDIALALDTVPKFTFLDILDDIRNIDKDMIESYLMPHESGIRVLPANAKPQNAEFVNAEHIEIILTALQNAFDYIIIDMPARYYETLNPAFTAANELLLVTNPEISTIRNTKFTIRDLSDLNYPKPKIKILLNKANHKGEIKEKDIENSLKISVFASLNVDYKLVPSSLNQGIPVVVSYPKSSISKGIMNLANKLIQSEEK